jgi:CobQ-like glutamine amidotransferase family enzyme
MATSSTKKEKSFADKIVDIIHSVTGGGDDTEAKVMTENIFERRKAALSSAEDAANSGKDTDEAYQKRMGLKK